MDLRIDQVEARDLDVALTEPFGIATGAQARAENLLVAVRLACGVTGYGEAAPFPAVNGETRALARDAVGEVSRSLAGRDARAWRPLSAWLSREIGPVASARCAIETAVLDALARVWGVPLWVFFGGAGTALQTDLTITTGDAEHAARAAARLAADGFATMKLKVGGKPLADDVERVERAVAAAPGVRLLLDGNAALDEDGAVRLIEAARRAGTAVALFEQPLAKDDLAGARRLRERTGCLAAADESATRARDVARLIDARAADVINVKITKSGVVEAMDMVALARAHGLGLMIGGMVETQLAMSMSACLAAGSGGFDFVDLDTPMFMIDAPLTGGFAQRGPALDLTPIERGHGVTPV